MGHRASTNAFTRYVFAVQYHGHNCLGFTYQGLRGENCVLYKNQTVQADLRGIESVEGRIRRALDRLVGVNNYSNIQVRYGEFVTSCYCWYNICVCWMLVLSSVPARIVVFTLGGTHFKSTFDLDLLATAILWLSRSGRLGVLRISSMALTSIWLAFQAIRLLQMITKTTLMQSTDLSRRLVWQRDKDFSSR